MPPQKKKWGISIDGGGVVASSANDAASATRHASALTAIRITATPYLPPPLIRTVHVVDGYVVENYPDLCSNDYIQNEPSIAFFGAWLVAYVLYRSLRGVNHVLVAGRMVGRRSTLHLNKGDDVMVGLSAAGTAGAPPLGGRDNGDGGDTGDPILFVDTVVLCGASGSGKTALLHYLCRDGGDGEGWRPPKTVMSLVTNAGYARADDARPAPQDTTTKGGECVRVIDYPGHPNFASRLPELIFPGVASRVVLAIDSSRPVAEGAGILYRSILVHPVVRSGWVGAGKTLPVLVACTKRDVEGSKNWKRIKIQLRTELDRLRKLDSTVAASGINNDGMNGQNNITLNVKGKSIDLDKLGSDVPVSLHFVEAGWDNGSGTPTGLEAIKKFVLSGTVPSAK